MDKQTAPPFHISHVCFKAGIKNDQLKLALEPEAASVYCKSIPMERRQHDSQGDTLGPFSPHTRYLVLDLGGQSVVFLPAVCKT